LSSPIENFANINEKGVKTLDILEEAGVVPPYSAFDITEEMIAEAVRVYGTLSLGGNKKFSYNLARKIWGLNLLRLKFSRGAKPKDCKEGAVYLIANPAWPEHLKIGMTVDTESRLASYQTYDPFKAFYIKNYEFCLDRRAAEQQLLERFNFHLAEGEWVKHSDSLEIIKVLRTY
jgi:hypothetical protein